MWQKAGEELGDEANTHILLHMLGAGTSVVLSIHVSYAAYQLSASPLFQVKNVWWEVLKPDSWHLVWTVPYFVCCASCMESFFWVSTSLLLISCFNLPILSSTTSSAMEVALQGGREGGGCGREWREVCVYILLSVTLVRDYVDVTCYSLRICW